MGGGLSPARLAAAVSEAGGLGTIGTIGTPPEWWVEQIAETRRLTERPFAVNVIMGQDGAQERFVRVCLEQRVPVVSFGGVGAERFFAPFKDAGILVLHQVGSVADACRSAEAGADAVIVQAAEAGGHLLGGLGAFALVPQAADAVAPVPVVLAGGVADGRGLAAALALGAQGVALGTRFLATTESGAHELYRRRLVEGSSEDVVDTAEYDEEWPHQPANVLQTGTLAAWLERVKADPSLKDRAREVVARATLGSAEVTIKRFSTATATETTTGEIDELPLYAGQSVGLVTEVESAFEVVSKIVADAKVALAGAGKEAEAWAL